MLMAALMGAVPEILIWNLVGEGAKKGHSNPWICFLAFCPCAPEEAFCCCLSTEGGTQVFLNNTSFAKWALTDFKVPQTLSFYIHSQSAVKKVKGSKVWQPSNEFVSSKSPEEDISLESESENENDSVKCANIPMITTPIVLDSDNKVQPETLASVNGQ
ncbi:hypothetical protein DFH28DRAFT_926212 [Melampsora americana]|nr:hypothetical protein DFH28DRAFT_926212 [Melampsora americana]